MINTALWSGFAPQNVYNQGAIKKEAAALRSDLFSMRAAPAGTDKAGFGVTPDYSVSPLAGHTGYRICTLSTETVPTTSWQEWLETLRPEVRDLIFSHPDEYGWLQEHLASMTVEQRAWTVRAVEEHITWWAKMEPIHNKLMQLGDEMGMGLTHFDVCFKPPHAIVAVFRCPDGNEDRIVTILEDGTKLMVDVPPGFAEKYGRDFIDEILNDLLIRRPAFSRDPSPIDRMREFFEYELRQRFGPLVGE